MQGENFVGTILDIYKHKAWQIDGKGDHTMKAKNSYSGLVATTTAKGSIVIFAGIVVFISGFVAWSVTGFGNAIVQFVKSI